MKRFLIMALLLIGASSVFAFGRQTVGNSHAENGYNYKDIAVAVVVSPADEGMMWLNATNSYPLLLSEKDKLVNLVQAGAKKIDIAFSNKTTVSYREELGRFLTDDAALVTVSFETDSYESSYTIVQIINGGKTDILLLNKNDTQNFINVLESTHSILDDYQKQVALFK